jgi:hypothetical protein
MSKAGTMDDTMVATMIQCLTTKTRAKISKDVVKEPEKSEYPICHEDPEEPLIQFNQRYLC